MKKLFILLLTIFLLAGCSNFKVTAVKVETVSGFKEQNTPVKSGQTDLLKVHIIDVGQGDSILVQLPSGQNMLVDAGTNASTDSLVDYLKKTGVKKIDYLVGTHPHEDHIGGMDAVVNTFDIGQIYMPKVTANTKTFRDVLSTIKEKDLNVTTARAGVDMLEDENLSVKMLAPCGTKYEDLNNYSAVIKVKYGDVAFLLMGDAEALSPAFLKAVAPQYAVISVGAGNDYGHPHKETLDKLKKAGVQVIRTDEQGTVVFSTDGKEINVTDSK